MLLNGVECEIGSRIESRAFLHVADISMDSFRVLLNGEQFERSTRFCLSLGKREHARAQLCGEFKDDNLSLTAFMHPDGVSECISSQADCFDSTGEDVRVGKITAVGRRSHRSGSRIAQHSAPLLHPLYDTRRDKRIYAPITIIIDLTNETRIKIIFFNHRKKSPEKFSLNIQKAITASTEKIIIKSFAS
jgi:hypothetical protein